MASSLLTTALTLILATIVSPTLANESHEITPSLSPLPGGIFHPLTTSSTSHRSPCTLKDLTPPGSICGSHGTISNHAFFSLDLYDPASTTILGCAAECARRDGCRAFTLRSGGSKPFCELLSGSLKEVGFREEVKGKTGVNAYQGFDMACFEVVTGGKCRPEKEKEKVKSSTSKTVSSTGPVSSSRVAMTSCKTTTSSKALTSSRTTSSLKSSKSTSVKTPITTKCVSSTAKVSTKKTSPLTVPSLSSTRNSTKKPNSTTKCTSSTPIISSKKGSSTVKQLSSTGISSTKKLSSTSKCISSTSRAYPDPRSSKSSSVSASTKRSSASKSSSRSSSTRQASSSTCRTSRTYPDPRSSKSSSVSASTKSSSASKSSSRSSSTRQASSSTCRTSSQTHGSSSSKSSLTHTSKHSADPTTTRSSSSARSASSTSTKPTVSSSSSRAIQSTSSSKVRTTSASSATTSRCQSSSSTYHSRSHHENIPVRPTKTPKSTSTKNTSSKSVMSSSRSSSRCHSGTSAHVTPYTPPVSSSLVHSRSSTVTVPSSCNSTGPAIVTVTKYSVSTIYTTTVETVTRCVPVIKYCFDGPTATTIVPVATTLIQIINIYPAAHVPAAATNGVILPSGYDISTVYNRVYKTTDGCSKGKHNCGSHTIATKLVPSTTIVASLDTDIEFHLPEHHGPKKHTSVEAHKTQGQSGTRVQSENTRTSVMAPSKKPQSDSSFDPYSKEYWTNFKPHAGSVNVASTPEKDSSKNANTDAYSKAYWDNFKPKGASAAQASGPEEDPSENDGGIDEEPETQDMDDFEEISEPENEEEGEEEDEDDDLSTEDTDPNSERFSPVVAESSASKTRARFLRRDAGASSKDNATTLRNSAWAPTTSTSNIAKRSSNTKNEGSLAQVAWSGTVFVTIIAVVLLM